MFLYVAICLSVHGCTVASPPEAQPARYIIRPNHDTAFKYTLEGASHARLVTRGGERVLSVVANQVMLDEHAYKALLDEATRLYVDDHQTDYRLAHQMQHNCPLIKDVTWSKDPLRPSAKLTLKQVTGQMKVFGDIDADPHTTACGAPGQWCIWWSPEDFLASVWSSPEPIYIDVHAHPRCQMTIDAHVLRSDKYYERQE